VHIKAYGEENKGMGDICVGSAGHIFAKQGRRVIRPYGRDDWLLFYVAKGIERFELQAPQDAPAGSFIIFKPGDNQSHVHLDEKGAEFYYIHFNATEDFDMCGLESSMVYHAPQNSEVCTLFEETIDELTVKRIAYEKVCVSKLYTILALLLRGVNGNPQAEKRYADKISFVIHTMVENFSDNMTLDEYAKMCSMSKFHFIRTFKEITGVSPIEYKNRIRFDKSKHLLESTSLSVGEIAEKLGFSSQSYFCDAFKKLTGVAPKVYREKYVASAVNFGNT